MKRWFSAAVCLALLAGLAQAEECKLSIVNRIQMVPNDSGDVEYVPVEVNGVPRRFLLDTGAELSVLSQKVADELNLKTKRTGLRLYSLTGKYTDRYTQVMLKLGSMKGKGKLMVMPELDDFDDDPQFAGLLGTDVLANYDISIDFGTHTLDMIDKNHCEGQVVYWPATVIAILPFHKEQSGAIIVNLKLDGRDFTAILDSGATRSTLRLHAAEQHFDIKPGSPETPEHGVLNGQEGLKTYSHTFKTLSFEGVNVDNPTFVLIPDMTTKHLAPDAFTGSRIAERDESVEADIILGMNVLRHLHVYIAYNEKKLYITAASKPAAQAEKTEQPAAAEEETPSSAQAAP